MEQKQLFTSDIIGKIRDAGIIIAGTNIGYKLALSVEDINDYLYHNKNVIFPMFARMKKARETIKVATSNEYDILETDNLLASLLETFSDRQIEIATEQYGEEDYENTDI
jgi:hypothetical protein